MYLVIIYDTTILSLFSTEYYLLKNATQIAFRLLCPALWNEYHNSFNFGSGNLPKPKLVDNVVVPTAGTILVD